MIVPRLSRPLLFLLGGVLAGCATTPPAPPSPQAQQLIQTLGARWSRFQDLRGRVEVTVSRDGATQRFDGVMLLKAPASLRFEALSPFGSPFLYLVASGQAFTFYNVVENRAVVGTDSAEGMRRLLGLPFTTEELVGLLAGYVLPLGDPETVNLSHSDGLGPALSLRGASWSQRIWFSRESELPHRVEFGGGRAPVRIDFEGGGASTPPSLITLRALDRPLEVLIRYRNAELGTGLLDGAFSLNLPARVRIQRVN